jgi:hypothetical protein
MPYAISYRSKQPVQSYNEVKLIPNAELKIIPGLDPAQAYWQGEQVVPLMLRFLKNGIQSNLERGDL